MFHTTYLEFDFKIFTFFISSTNTFESLDPAAVVFVGETASPVFFFEIDNLLPPGENAFCSIGPNSESISAEFKPCCKVFNSNRTELLPESFSATI